MDKIDTSIGRFIKNSTNWSKKSSKKIADNVQIAELSKYNSLKTL